MEKNHKIIIVGLIIVIIALIAGLAYMLMGNNSLNGDGSVPDGMKIYDFNSEFKMAVPESVQFLKSWDNEGTMGKQYTYFDENNEIAVSYIDSPMINPDVIDAIVKAGNSTGNATIEYDGDLIISHNIKNDGKVAKSFEDTKFKESVVIQKGHMFVSVLGNDLDLIKSMINTIEFNE